MKTSPNFFGACSVMLLTAVPAMPAQAALALSEIHPAPGDLATAISGTFRDLGHEPVPDPSMVEAVEEAAFAVSEKRPAEGRYGFRAASSRTVDLGELSGGLDLAEIGRLEPGESHFCDVLLYELLGEVPGKGAEWDVDLAAIAGKEEPWEVWTDGR